MDLAKVDAILNEYECDKSWLVMILQDIQGIHNYLPPPALWRVAERLDIGMAHVYNVATFYSSFSLKERGRHLIRACDGTACHLRGAVNVRDEITRLLGITEGETTADKLFTLEVVACLGACALAPVMSVDTKYYSKLTPKKVAKALDAYRRAELAVVSET